MEFPQHAGSLPFTQNGAKCSGSANRSKEMPQTAKPMSRTLAIEIATKTIAVTNPANRGLRMADLLDKHGFRRVQEPDIDILTDQARLVSWLRETFKV